VVLEKLLDKIEQLEQKVGTLQPIHRPYPAQPTRRWVSATPVDKSLPSVESEPAPVASRHMKVRRSSLLDIFD
jgi:hypothetical protein